MSAFPNPGIHADVPESVYHSIGHKDGVLSKSLLWRFWQSPFKWKFGPDKGTTKAMQWGSLVDSLLFTPSETEKAFIVSPYSDFRTKEAREWKRGALESGREVVTDSEWQSANEAVLQVGRHPIASEIIMQSYFQLAAVTEMTGSNSGETFRLKSRIDIAPESGSEYVDFLFDLKTISDLGNIEKAIADFGYHGQAALYLDVWNLASGDNRNRFGFVFQESTAPYEVAVVELERADIGAGRYWYQDAISLWAKCHAESHFPSRYEDGIETVSRPLWAEEQELIWNLE